MDGRGVGKSSAFSRAAEKIKTLAARGLRRFPAAYLWSAALFLFASWTELADVYRIFSLRGMAALCCGLAMAAALSLWAERLRKFPWLPWLSLPLAAACYFALGVRPYPDFLTLYGAGLALASAAAGLFAYRDADALFPRVFCAALKALGAALLTALSLGACLAAADALLFDLPSELYQILFYFAFFVVGAWLFLAWLPEHGEDIRVPDGFETLLRRLFVPVYLVLTAILLAYTVKISLAGELPVTAMAWYSSLALFGYAFLYVSLCGAGGARLSRFLRLAPLALLPAVLAHLLGMGSRIAAYGLTTQRYAVLLCTAYGALVAALGVWKRKPRALYPFAAALLLFATVSPANILELPARDQRARAATVLEKYGMLENGKIVRGAPLTEEDRARLLSAYRYLRWDDTRHTDALIGELAASEILEAEAARAGAEKLARERETGDAAFRLHVTDESPFSVEGYRTLRVVRGKVENGVLHAGDENFPVSIDWEAIAGGYQTELSFSCDVDDKRRLIFRDTEIKRQENGTLEVFAEAYLLEK